MCWYGRDFDDDEDDEYDDNVNDEYDEYDDSNIRLAVVDHHHNYHLSIMIVTIHHLFIIYSSSIHQVNKQLFNKSLTPEQSRYSRDALARVIYKTLFNWIVNEVGG